MKKFKIVVFYEGTKLEYKANYSSIEDCLSHRKSLLGTGVRIIEIKELNAKK